MKAQDYIPPRAEIFRTQIESAVLTASPLQVQEPESYELGEDFTW